MFYMSELLNVNITVKLLDFRGGFKLNYQRLQTNSSKKKKQYKQYCFVNLDDGWMNLRNLWKLGNTALDGKLETD